MPDHGFCAKALHRRLNAETKKQKSDTHYTFGVHKLYKKIKLYKKFSKYNILKISAYYVTQLMIGGATNRDSQCYAL